jgi:hypothetical protein
MEYFQTKNTNLGKFRRALEWKMLVHIFKEIWKIVWPFGWLYGNLGFLWSFGKLLRSFGICTYILYKNLATLLSSSEEIIFAQKWQPVELLLYVPTCLQVMKHCPRCKLPPRYVGHDALIMNTTNWQVN